VYYVTDLKTLAHPVNGEYLDGMRHKAMMAWSFIDCMSACRAVRQCLGVNFYYQSSNLSHTCELLSEINTKQYDSDYVSAQFEI